jgi:hypothetical protein
MATAVILVGGCSMLLTVAILMAQRQREELMRVKRRMELSRIEAEGEKILRAKAGAEANAAPTFTSSASSPPSSSSSPSSSTSFAPSPGASSANAYEAQAPPPDLFPGYSGHQMGIYGGFRRRLAEEAMKRQGNGE